MQNLYFTLFSLLLTASSLHAQQYKWVQDVVSDENVGLFGIDTDAAGNTYVTGYIDGDTYLDGNTLVSQGGRDFYVAKFDPDGALLWHQTFGGANTDAAYDIFVDDPGNVYFGGTFSEDCTFGDSTYTSNGLTDIFVANMDTDGNLQWVRQFGGGSNDVCNKLVAANGVLVAVGQFSLSFDFAGTGVEAAGSQDAWIAEFAATDGSVNWVDTQGGTGLDRYNSVAMAANGELAVGGTFAETVVIGADQLMSQNGGDPLLVKYTAGGTPIWARAGNTDEPVGLIRDVQVDAAGNIYASGSFSGLLEYEENFLTGFAQDVVNPFLLSVDPDGDFRWVQGLLTEETIYPGQLLLLDNILYFASTVVDGVDFAGNAISVEQNGAAIFGLDLDGQQLSSFIVDESNNEGTFHLAETAGDLVFSLNFQTYIELDGQAYNGLDNSDLLIIRMDPETETATTLVGASDLTLPRAHWDAGSQLLHLREIAPEFAAVSIFTINGVPLANHRLTSSDMQLRLPVSVSGVLVLQYHTTSGETGASLLPVNP